MTKRFGKLTAVNNLNISIKRGQTYGFLGPNGAGKSTTIRMLTGFLRPTEGIINVLGGNIAEHGDVRKRIGLVPDTYGFYSVFNAQDHLEFYGRLSGLSADFLKKRIPEVFALVGFEKDWRARKLAEYSHGMKQRLCIAQAIIHNPDIIFLDEPTSGLDPAGVLETRNLVKKLSSSGMTVFISSHVLSEVEAICSHVGIINRGSLVMEGAIDDLRKQMANLEGIKITIKVGAIEDALLDTVRSHEAVTNLDVHRGDTMITLEIITRNPDLVPEITALLTTHSVKIYEVSESKPTLESVFLQATGKGGAS